MNKLSVLIPVFNEAQSISKILDKIRAVHLDNVSLEIIIVNDCSTDHTEEIALNYIKEHNQESIFYHSHANNMGKGAAISTALSYSTGDFVIIQDADLEYSPTEYQRMLEAMLVNKADAVFGSRFMTAGPRRAIYFWHRVGNLILTTLSNCLTNIYLTDMETCHKMIKLELVKKLDLKENRFGIEPEITAKLAKLNAVIYEIPIQYRARSYDQGKKIGWKDGVSAVRVIVKYSIMRFPK
jgi:glycosyltransferase involved in cell wall biosynthesis